MTFDLSPRLLSPHRAGRALSRGALARALVAKAAGGIDVRLSFPEGTMLGGGGPHSPVVVVRRPRELFARLEAHPKIGLGEGFMAGDWGVADGTDLADALAPFAARLGTLLPPWAERLRGVVDRALPHEHRNTPDGSRRNIAAHYDLSNELFAQFLDESLTYSSALFDDSRAWGEQSLREAQHRKIDGVLDAAHIGPGSRVLEIGTGWGELAMRAAARGAKVRTLTLSDEQKSLAQKRIADAGLAGQVEVLLEDYRSASGEYDAVVSVEMIEAVGEEFWPDYFRTLEARVVPGGRVVVQAILMDHARMLRTRNSFGWIQKYIFPGGLIPSREAIADVVTAHTTLQLVEDRPYGLHYAETLRRWRHTFTARSEQVAALGFDESFRRMWEFYLAYSEAGFASGYLDVARLTWRRPNDTYDTVTVERT